MKNAIAKKVQSSTNQITAMGDERAQHVYLRRIRWQTLSSRWFFVNTNDFVITNVDKTPTKYRPNLVNTQAIGKYSPT